MAQGPISQWLHGDRVNKATRVQADLTPGVGVTETPCRCLLDGSYFDLTGPATSTVSASFPISMGTWFCPQSSTETTHLSGGHGVASTSSRHGVQTSLSKLGRESDSVSRFRALLCTQRLSQMPLTVLNSESVKNFF